MNKAMNIPVIFIFFNKITTTKTVFEKVKNAKPSILFLVSDGARKEKTGEDIIVQTLRRWIESQIDWDCDVIKDYSDRNLGCKNRVVSGISNAFKKVDKAIIIEDDCLPRLGFFEFCQQMLTEYEDNTEVMLISGDNFLAKDYYIMESDYIFSKNAWIWGWATWKRAWDLYDASIPDWPEYRNSGKLNELFESSYRINNIIKSTDAVYNNEIDTWDYQLCYTIWKNGGLCVVPKHMLVDNIGIGIPEALHTHEELPLFWQKAFEDKSNFEDRIRINRIIERDILFDRIYDEVEYNDYVKSRKLARRIKNKIVRIIGLVIKK